MMKTRHTSFSNSPDAAVSRRVLLANPRGFCAGVDRAIEAVEAALRRFGAPVYVRRAIVHNRAVVERLEAHGAIFVQELDAVPEGAIVLLSAHGSSRAIKIEGQNRRLRLVDTVCPLVSKVHAGVEAWYRAGRHILLIGHHGHPEIIGTLGQVPTGAVSVISRPEDLDTLDLGRNTAVGYAVQTTYSVRDAESMISAIRERFDDVACLLEGDGDLQLFSRFSLVLHRRLPSDPNYASGVGRRRQRDHYVDRTSRDGVRSVEMAVFWGFRLLGM